MSLEETLALPTWSEAKKIGSKYFYNGPCPAYGHVAYGTTSSHQCSECNRMNANRHYQANGEKKREYQKEYQRRTYIPHPKPTVVHEEPSWEKRNPEKTRLNKRAYYHRHPEKLIAKTRRYYARKMSAPGDGITGNDIKELKRRQCYKCAICLKKTKLELDHILAITKGGEHSVRNAQMLCKPCNSAKSARDHIVFVQSRGLLL